MNQSVPPASIPVVEKPARNAPIFVVLSVVAFVLSMTTPRFLLFFPMMAVLGFSVLSIFRKEKGRIVAVAVLILTVGLFVLVQGGGSAIDTAEYLVSYDVGGTATTASLTFANAQGGTEQEKASLPWRRNITVKSGSHLYISAQNQNDDGDITVRIEVDGKDFKRSNASGAHAIASASGLCCK